MPLLAQAIVSDYNYFKLRFAHYHHEGVTIAPASDSMTLTLLISVMRRSARTLTTR